MSMTALQDITFHDDTFDYNPDLQDTFDRQDNAPLPAPGYYRIKVVAGGFKMDRTTGTRRHDKSDRPIFTIQRIAVLEPEDAAGSFPIFQDIYTTGLPAKNFKTGEILKDKPMVYKFIELMRAIDATSATRDYDENVKTLARMLDSKPTLTVRLGYEGKDVSYAKSRIAAGEPSNDAYKAARLNGQAFRNADGTYRTETEGPSGELVQAKLTIAEFVPETRSVVLGPLKRR